MDLRVETPATADSFREAMKAAGIRLPVTIREIEPGVIVDAADVQVFVVDPMSERPDAEANAVAALIVLAINTCGGFCAAPATAPSEA